MMTKYMVMNESKTNFKPTVVYLAGYLSPILHRRGLLCLISTPIP